MHTLHYWLVEAEDKEQAFSAVKDRLINDDGTNWVDWSDWHVVGGGRWNDLGDGYTDQSNMIVSYANDPDKFNKIITDVKSARVKEMQNIMPQIDTNKFISDMVDYISSGASLGDDTRFSMNQYYIKQACELMSDHYTSDSYFYDLIEYTANMSYIQDHLDKKNKEMLFLVPIDFHF